MQEEGTMSRITITINGKAETREVEDRTLLVQFIREHVGLTGTHVGCDTTQCGACTIHLDGEAVKSCTVLAVAADGAEVTTIEGLADGRTLHPVQRAFHEHHGLQCGYCTPGMIMSVKALLDETPNPTTEQIQEGLSGNICRCTGYGGILRAVKKCGGSACT
jgi:carbon-monoxide dehydrogenase small subunit